MFSDNIVKASVLFSHYEPFASGDVVEMHGELYHHPIQCKEDVQYLVEVALADDVIAPFPFVLLCHSVHSASAPSEEMIQL